MSNRCQSIWVGFRRKHSEVARGVSLPNCIDDPSCPPRPAPPPPPSSPRSPPPAARHPMSTSIFEWSRLHEMGFFGAKQTRLQVLTQKHTSRGPTYLTPLKQI